MRCNFIACLKQPSFNFKGERPIYCAEHKSEGMVNVRDKTCLMCDKRASFNFKDKRGGIYCAEHKLEGMINLKCKTCLNINCIKQPAYNFKDKRGGIYCAEHKLDGMIDVNNNTCLSCIKRANYNFYGLGVGVYCAEHKLDGMINVNSKTCKNELCHKRPNYNYKEAKGIGIYCAEHKLEGMIDVKNKSCLECFKQPCYNYETEKMPIYCAEHKLEGMIDVKNLRCFCGKIACFNFLGSKPKFCVEHKMDGMIDIKHKLCQSCKINRAYYGFPGHQPKFCSNCKELGTIQNPRIKCLTENCKNMALYGYRAQIACELHKSDDMTNMVEGKCIRCNLIYILSPDGFCENCCEDWIGIIRRKKEYEVKHFLLRNNFEFISHDKKIQHSSLLNRPDFLFLSYNQKFYVILEIDEYQHSFNKEECECIRMVNISQELGKPTIFIRYNPDEYKNGVKNVNPKLSERQKELKAWLRGALSKTEEDLKFFGYLCFVQLYYDNYIKGGAKYETILDWN